MNITGILLGDKGWLLQAYLLSEETAVTQECP